MMARDEAADRSAADGIAVRAFEETPGRARRAIVGLHVVSRQGRAADLIRHWVIYLGQARTDRPGAHRRPPCSPRRIGAASRSAEPASLAGGAGAGNGACQGPRRIFPGADHSAGGRPADRGPGHATGSDRRHRSHVPAADAARRRLASHARQGGTRQHAPRPDVVSRARGGRLSAPGLRVGRRGRGARGDRQRVGDLLANMSPDDQAWVLALLHEMPAALRGGYNTTPAIATVMQRLAGTEAAAALNAGPRRYVMSRHGGRTMTWVPSVLVGFALTDATAHWKPGHPTGAQAALLGAVGSADLIQQRAGGLLAAAQYAWRTGTYDADWELAVDRIAAHAGDSVFSWGPNDLALIAALTAVDRIAGSPWLGPLKPQLTAAQFESSDWALLLAAMAASDGASKPGKGIAAKWAGSLAAIGTDVFRERVMGWLAQHPLDPQSPDPDADALKQLIWLVGTTGESRSGTAGPVCATLLREGAEYRCALGQARQRRAGGAWTCRATDGGRGGTRPAASAGVSECAEADRGGAGTGRQAGRHDCRGSGGTGCAGIRSRADGRVHAMTDAGGVTLALTEGRRVTLTWHGAVAHDAGGRNWPPRRWR